MKKKYTTPVCTTIGVRTPHLLTASENKYWGDKEKGDQGLIHFEEDAVAPESSD